MEKSNDKRISDEVINELIMLTRDEVSYLLKATPEMVTVWQDLGMLQSIRTGRNYMFSQSEILRFQNDFRGYDISTYEKSKKAYDNVICAKIEKGI